MEHLSRYQIARRFLPVQTSVIVQSGQSSWWSPYLEIAGAKNKVLETIKGTIFSKEVYYVPLLSESITNLVGEPKHYLELRKNALSGKRIRKTPVFISRNDAPRRRLLNEDQLFKIAREKIPSIERISLDNLSFDDQIESISGATILISPHGQGSHISLFSKNTTSIQLVPGVASLKNPYFECALLYDYLASLGGYSQTISCASGIESINSNDDWYYPEAKFEYEINKVISFHKAIKN
jgi:capsular polysaccharide biosynthesis protein